ncbi:helix-turn-helix domain-containing protein [Deinococcus oregonensis]|uniref:Helix-turn-helix domain-containing protein n=1 Tax=Deinococcus oregonensis TaxID=1805970 RepID=A0ABV6B8P9_9DEIO
MVIVGRAKVLLGVAAGLPSTQAAQDAGRTSGDGVAHLVARFNQHGLNALATRPSRRSPRTYGSAQRNRILDTARR